jgi:hypothetical protein
MLEEFPYTFYCRFDQWVIVTRCFIVCNDYQLVLCNKPICNCGTKRHTFTRFKLLSTTSSSFREIQWSLVVHHNSFLIMNIKRGSICVDVLLLHSLHPQQLQVYVHLPRARTMTSTSRTQYTAWPTSDWTSALMSSSRIVKLIYQIKTKTLLNRDGSRLALKKLVTGGESHFYFPTKLMSWLLTLQKVCSFLIESWNVIIKALQCLHRLWRSPKYLKGTCK